MQVDGDYVKSAVGAVAVAYWRIQHGRAYLFEIQQQECCVDHTAEISAEITAPLCRPETSSHTAASDNIDNTSYSLYVASALTNGNGHWMWSFRSSWSVWLDNHTATLNGTQRWPAGSSYNTQQ